MESVVILFCVGNNVTKNGGPVLKRQHSSGSEEQMLNGVRRTIDKKASPTNENQSWSSLEDLSKLSSYTEFEKDSSANRSPLSNLNNKKGSSRKTKPTRQNGNIAIRCISFLIEIKKQLKHFVIDLAKCVYFVCF